MLAISLARVKLGLAPIAPRPKLVLDCNRELQGANRLLRSDGETIEPQPDGTRANR